MPRSCDAAHVGRPLLVRRFLGLRFRGDVGRAEQRSSEGCGEIVLRLNVRFRTRRTLEEVVLELIDLRVGAAAAQELVPPRAISAERLIMSTRYPCSKEVTLTNITPIR